LDELAEKNEELEKTNKKLGKTNKKLEKTNKELEKANRKLSEKVKKLEKSVSKKETEVANATNMNYQRERRYNDTILERNRVEAVNHRRVVNKSLAAGSAMGHGSKWE
jgi:peptidoglycan hydrolase CwlO-like protein